MTRLIPENFETVAPSEADAALARESSRLLAALKLGRKKSVRIRLGDDDEAEALTVPMSALRLFQHLLAELSNGNAVTLIPTHSELTTQQATDLLNVSRPSPFSCAHFGVTQCEAGPTNLRRRRIKLAAFVVSLNSVGL